MNGKGRSPHVLADVPVLHKRKFLQGERNKAASGGMGRRKPMKGRFLCFFPSNSLNL